MIHWTLETVGRLCSLIRCSYLSHMARGESHWQTLNAMCRQTTFFSHWSWNQKVFCSRCFKVVNGNSDLTKRDRQTTELYLHCSPWVFLLCLSSSDLLWHSQAGEVGTCIATCLRDGNLCLRLSGKLLQPPLWSPHDRELPSSLIPFIEFH